jgi:hypothetical protein
MADAKLYFIVAVLIAILIYNFFFSKAAVVKRNLREANGKKISAFQNDEVAKVIGEIKYVGKTLTAPLSGRQCVYYYILVERLKGHTRTVAWEDLIEEEVAGDVVIKDGNNYAVIETRLVKSHLVSDRNYSSGLFNAATEELKKYLAKHGHADENFFGLDKQLRYKEGILEEGEMLAVVGKGKWVTKNQIKLKIPADKVLLISADNEEPVYLSDDPDTIDEVEN